MLELIGIIIALLGVAYSSYTDIKTGEVSDKLSHSMIGIGAILVVFSNPLSTSLWLLGIAAVVFILGFIMYIFGQIGGGDVKLFTALALLIPIYPKSLASFVETLGITPITTNYPFIVSVFLLSGIFFMLVIPLIYLNKIAKQKKKIKDFDRKIRNGVIYCILFSPMIYLWLQISKLVALIFIPIFFALMIIPFKDDIVRLFFARKKRIAELNDDDVLALECISPQTVKKLKLWRKTFTPPELKRIKALARKHKISTVTVCEDLPKYVPYIFLSLILNLLVGDVFLYLFMLG